MAERNKKENVLIIDADFILYVATSGNKILDACGNPLRENGKLIYTDKTFEEVIQSADFIINDLLKKSKFKYYIGYLGNSKSFRYDDYPEYKGNRTFEKPNFFNELKEYLNLKWEFILLNNGLEADDAVNIARNQLKNDFNLTIATSDKDLIKCIPGKYINVRDLSIIRTSKEKADEAFWTSMIVGDSIDNIKGIKGAGKVAAEKLFKNKKPEEYKDLVLSAYYDKYKEEGKQEFDKNYKLLYILDSFDNFEINLKEINNDNSTEERTSNSEELW